MVFTEVKPTIDRLYKLYHGGKITEHQLESDVLRLITPDNVVDVLRYLDPETRAELIVHARITPRDMKFRVFGFDAVVGSSEQYRAYQEEETQKYMTGLYTVKDYAEANNLL